MSEPQLKPVPSSGAATPVTTAQRLPGNPGCWSEIGVYGTSACAELEAHVHCRNCPTYAKAGLELLSRPLSAEYRREWSAHFAQPRTPRERSTTSAVPFRIGSEWLALPTRSFQEITERRPIHSVPHTRQMVLGLANIRGELLICVSLGHLLGLPNVPPRTILQAEFRRLLVLNWNGRRAGFPVHEVHGPTRFYPEQVKPTPAMLARSNTVFTESLLHWGQKTLALLDPDSLFSALNRSLA
jgi:chemotaxis-related protein WspD